MLSLREDEVEEHGTIPFMSVLGCCAQWIHTLQYAHHYSGEK